MKEQKSRSRKQDEDPQGMYLQCTFIRSRSMNLKRREKNIATIGGEVL